MAKRQANKAVIILSSVLSFIVGLVFSAFAVVYLSIPDSGVIPATQVARSNTVVSGDINVDKITSEDLSIHFLELGNKYTGDCTLIKVGNTEILIDAGSRASSVPVIQSYLDQYVTDHKLEYVIVTHAHQDHIAGFGTSASTDSIFDLYDVGTVIQFVYHNTDSTVYKNYCRELDELRARCATKVFNALQCVEETDGAQKIYDLSTDADIKLEILDQDYYHTTTSGENNYSVCCQIIQNDEKYYLFTGDLEEKGEKSLVARNTLHPVELFKAGHHGSKTSSTDALLSVIQPKIVCVCCCAGSSEYKAKDLNTFPTQAFVDRIAPYTDQIFVTTLCEDYNAGEFESLNGNIVVYYSREEDAVAVACSNNTTILKDTDWFKNNRELPDTWVA